MILKDITGRPTIDIILRTTQQHHVQLSAMADQKANIIIAFGSVVFTVALSQIGAMRLTWGFLSLALTAASAMAMAIMSLIPRFERAKSTSVSSSFNPLFFGHFADLSEDEYVRRMSTLFDSDATMYETIVRDIHQIGMVLQKKKYRYLRRSYLVFLSGVVVSTIVFGVEVVATYAIL